MTLTAMPGQTADADATGGKDKGKGKGGGKQKLIVVVVFVLAAAAYLFVMRPSGPKAPEPGDVVQIEPIQVNLTGGHYLKVGIALQLTTKAKEADGSKALDATIELFSGRSMEELTRTDVRKRLKVELKKELGHLYEGEVMDVYFTDFVTQ